MIDKYSPKDYYLVRFGNGKKFHITYTNDHFQNYQPMCQVTHSDIKIHRQLPSLSHVVVYNGVVCNRCAYQLLIHTDMYSVEGKLLHWAFSKRGKRITSTVIEAAQKILQ